MTDIEDLEYGRARTQGFRHGYNDGLYLARQELSPEQWQRVEQWLEEHGWHKGPRVEVRPRIQQGIEQVDQERRERVVWGVVAGVVLALIVIACGAKLL